MKIHKVQDKKAYRLESEAKVKNGELGHRGVSEHIPADKSVRPPLLGQDVVPFTPLKYKKIPGEYVTELGSFSTNTYVGKQGLFTWKQRCENVKSEDWSRLAAGLGKATPNRHIMQGHCCFMSVVSSAMKNVKD